MPNVPASRSAARPSAPSAYEDIDAITPCPSSPSDSGDSSPVLHGAPATSVFVAGSPCDEVVATYPDQRRHHGSGGQRPPSPTSTLSAASRTSSELSDRQRRSSLHRALEEGTGGDPERLWRKMLALQQIYGCYNSARMSAALESDDASLLLPSKACLDLLNENMNLLPDEVEQVLKPSK